MTGEDTGVADADKPTARDLVRKRKGDYRRDETGRHHHIGAAPELQPQLDDDGMRYAETSDVQLAARTVRQLSEQRSRVEAAMSTAAAELRFEDAGRLRDDLARLDAELARRGSASGG